MKKTVISAVVLAIFLLLFGCSSTDKRDKEYTASTSDIEKYSGTDVALAIKETQAKIDKAAGDTLETYAPKHLKRSKEILAEASELIYSKDDSLLSKLAILKKKLTEEEKKKLFFSKIALSQEYIKNGYVVKDLILREMKDVFKLRDSIDKLKGEKEYPGDYDSLAERIKDMMDEVEEEKTKYTYSKRRKLIGDLKALKAKIVIKVSLKEARKVLAKIRDKKFEQLAKKTYLKAMKTYDESVAYIKKETDNDVGVKDASAKALFSANHAWFVAKEITRLMRVIGELKEEDSHKLEEVVLSQEKQLMHIGEALKAKDVRDRSLTDQANEIAKIGTAIIQSTKKLQESLLKIKQSMTSENQTEEKSEDPETPADAESSPSS